MNYPYAHLNLNEETTRLQALSNYNSEKGYVDYLNQLRIVDDMTTHKEGRPYIPVGTKVIMTDGRVRMTNTAEFVRHSHLEGHAVLATSFITNSWAYPKGNHFPYKDFRLSEFQSNKNLKRPASPMKSNSFMDARGE